jgi:LPXTG-motif cell wall-anchored protein
MIIKIKKKKNIFLSLFVLIAVLSMVFTTSVFANDLSVESKDLEFEIIPQDQNLINILNMTPGDSITSNLTIANNYVNEVEIYLRAERLDEEPLEEEPDLYKQIQMKVTLEEDVIHEGKMIDFASEDGIFLGLFQPGDVQELNVEASLPGLETGNEFMGLSHSNRWIFTISGEEILLIEDEDPPLGPAEDPDEDVVIIEDEDVPLGGAKLPQTGGTPAALFFLAGAAIVTAGITLKKKQR